jgi:hypothetical protein
MARGELVHAVTHVIRTHRLDRFSRRELAVAILDVVEPIIRADERAKQPRVEVEAALGEPTTCKVWFDDRLVFDGMGSGVPVLQE